MRHKYPVNIKLEKGNTPTVVKQLKRIFLKSFLQEIGSSI